MATARRQIKLNDTIDDTVQFAFCICQETVKNHCSKDTVALESANAELGEKVASSKYLGVVAVCKRDSLLVKVYALDRAVEMILDTIRTQSLGFISEMKPNLITIDAKKAWGVGLRGLA